jgi:hypothetical protein
MQKKKQNISAANVFVLFPFNIFANIQANVTRNIGKILNGANENAVTAPQNPLFAKPYGEALLFSIIKIQIPLQNLPPW